MASTRPPLGSPPDPRRPRRAASGVLAVALALSVAGCGGAARASPPASSRRPPPGGRRETPPPRAAATPTRRRAPARRRIPAGDCQGLAPTHAGIRYGRLVYRRFFSPALGRDDGYLVYLPPGYAATARAAARFPVVYLLHGDVSGAAPLVRYYSVTSDADAMIAAREIRPLLVVMPEGCDGTRATDTEWANSPDGRYEDDLLDLVGAVDRRWRTIPSRRARTIGGLSMGAYGAINTALHHPDVFSVAESWSGYFTQTPTGTFRRASAGTLRANSPAAYADRLAPLLRRYPMHVLLYGGKNDPYSRQIASFARTLRAVGAHVVAYTVPGRHSGRLWRSQLPRALRYASQWMH